MKKRRLKFYTWVVEFKVEAAWIVDGFDCTPSRAQAMIEEALPYASPREVSAKVLKAPSKKVIDKEQGYPKF